MDGDRAVQKVGYRNITHRQDTNNDFQNFTRKPPIMQKQIKENR